MHSKQHFDCKCTVLEAIPPEKQYLSSSCLALLGAGSSPSWLRRQRGGGGVEKQGADCCRDGSRCRHGERKAGLEVAAGLEMLLGRTAARAGRDRVRNVMGQGMMASPAAPRAFCRARSALSEPPCSLHSSHLWAMHREQALGSTGCTFLAQGSIAKKGDGAGGCSTIQHTQSALW